MVSSCTSGLVVPPTPVDVAPTADAPQASHSGLTRIVDEDALTVWATEGDRQTAQDVAQAVRLDWERVCADLQTACEFRVVIEIYPDQAGFDRYVMNQAMRGYFAISGSPYTIQMVSPANPAPHKIAYADGVSVAVHEFVHLALDEINPALPAWLDEGTAVALGPHAMYTAVCEAAFPFDMVPSFQKLMDAYASVPAADLFAYTAVDYLISRYGLASLHALIRAPDSFERILQVGLSEFEADWKHYLQNHCRSAER